MNAKLMILTDAAITGGSVGCGVGAGVGRGVETTGCGVGAGVSTGVGEAVGDGVGDGVALVAAGDWDGGGDDWLVVGAPQAVSKHATAIARDCRVTCSSAEKFRRRLIPVGVTTV